MPGSDHEQESFQTNCGGEGQREQLSSQLTENSPGAFMPINADAFCKAASSQAGDKNEKDVTVRFPCSGEILSTAAGYKGMH